MKLKRKQKKKKCAALRAISPQYYADINCIITALIHSKPLILIQLQLSDFLCLHSTSELLLLLSSKRRRETVTGTTLHCNTSKKTYYENGSIFNLTASSGAKDYVESMPLVTEFFSTTFMSFLYERGWRQNFGLGGYPGPDREFEMAKEYFKPVFGGNIVDASCGSGLFSRLFSKSGLFSFVVGLDYSEAMLRQCIEFIKEDISFPKENLILVRADIHLFLARLMLCMLVPHYIAGLHHPLLLLK